MKTYIIPALRITIVTLVFFGFVYTGAVWAVAQLAPNKGQGFIIEQNGKRYYTNIGQKFNDVKYFWGRPSAAEYNAASSAGSNKGATNADYLHTVQTRIDSFMAYHPYLKNSEIPSDIVTASGSGLDPHISVQAARIQIKRIAINRKKDEKTINALVEKHIEKPLFGLFGTSRVNVLELNLDLDNLK